MAEFGNLNDLSDIVVRLRIVDEMYTSAWAQALMDEAADEIVRLRDENLEMAQYLINLWPTPRFMKGRDVPR